VLAVISCPGCGVPAEITKRFSLPSTDGPVDHIALRCVAGHHFRMPVDMLPQGRHEVAASVALTANPRLEILGLSISVMNSSKP
jgi:hypothetical protein